MAIAIGLAGCAQDGSQQSLGQTIGITTRQVAPKDWVSAQRPGERDFIPVGVTPAARPKPAMDAQQLAAATTELDSLRVSNEADARRPVPPASDNQAALLAEQRRRLSAAGLLGKARLPDEAELRAAAAKSRNFAKRPLPGAPASVPAEQPTSWPVPENRRVKLKGVKDCPAGAKEADCKDGSGI